MKSRFKFLCASSLGASTIWSNTAGSLPKKMCVFREISHLCIDKVNTNRCCYVFSFFELWCLRRSTLGSKNYVNFSLISMNKFGRWFWWIFMLPIYSCIRLDSSLASYLALAFSFVSSHCLHLCILIAKWRWTTYRCLPFTKCKLLYHRACVAVRMVQKLVAKHESIYHAFEFISLR